MFREDAEGMPAALLYIVQRPLPPLCESDLGGTSGNREPGMAAAADVRAKVTKKEPTLGLGFVPGVLM